MVESNSPDFAKLVTYYQQKLTNGQRAELRKVEQPDDLLDVPAFYHLVNCCRDLAPNQQAGRLIYFLPYVSHVSGAKPLGTLMQSKTSEKRLFQVIRADFPDDLVYLRRICKQLKPTVDWEQFGKMMYYWGHDAKYSKRQLLKDYYLKSQKENK